MATEYFTKDGEDFKKVDETLLPESSVNGIVERRLEQQKRNQFGDYDELKEKAGKVDTLTKEFETKIKEKDTQITSLTGDLGKAKLETDKVKIVSEFKLSDELAEFVTGDTVDEMRAKAEKLNKGLPNSGVNIDKKKKPESETTDSKKLAKSLFGGNKSDD